MGHDIIKAGKHRVVEDAEIAEHKVRRLQQKKQKKHHSTMLKLGKRALIVESFAEKDTLLGRES